MNRLPPLESDNNASPKRKKLKTDTLSLESEDEKDDATGDNQCKILLLNADCWKKLLECLPIKDLCLMGQTCRHIKQIAGEFFPKPIRIDLYILKWICSVNISIIS